MYTYRRYGPSSAMIFLPCSQLTKYWILWNPEPNDLLLLYVVHVGCHVPVMGKLTTEIEVDGRDTLYAIGSPDYGGRWFPDLRGELSSGAPGELIVLFQSEGQQAWNPRRVSVSVQIQRWKKSCWPSLKAVRKHFLLFPQDSQHFSASQTHNWLYEAHPPASMSLLISMLISLNHSEYLTKYQGHGTVRLTHKLTVCCSLSLMCPMKACILIRVDPPAWSRSWRWWKV